MKADEAIAFIRGSGQQPETPALSATGPAKGSDQILAALQYLARLWRKPDSQSFLTAGLPLVDGHMTMDLVAPAMSRIGVVTHGQNRAIRELADFEFPAMTIGPEGELLVLLGRAGRRAYHCFDATRGEDRVIDTKSFNVREPRDVVIFTPNYAMVQENSGTRFARTGHWLWSSFRGHGRSILYVLAAATFINLFAIAFPIFTLNVYDRVLPNAAISTLWVLAVGLVLVLLFDIALKLARGAIIDHVGRNIDFKLSSLLFDRVLNTPMEARPASTGAFVNRIAQYEVLRDFLSSSTLVMFVDLLFLGIFAWVITILVGWLVLFPLIAGAIAIAVTLVVGWLSGGAVRAALKESSARNAVLVEALTGAQSVKAARAEGQLLRRWESTVLASSETQNTIKWLQSVSTNITATLTQLSMSGIIIGGTFMAAAGDITMGAIVAAMMLSNRLIAPISLIASLLLRTRSTMESYETVDQIMKLPDERSRTDGFSARSISQGRISFNKVRFAYPGSKTFVLDGISFKAAAGEKIGIIGRIGSGKTTLGRMLVGFHAPSEGEILIDGSDIAQFHPADLRRGVGLVLQDPELFNGTVRENILLADPTASEERMQMIARRAGVEEFVSRHPQGYNMQVGERGILLSGGQRQAVALARTLLCEPKILFLDEPSSSMDLATERQLIANLEASLTPEQTVLVATHRYSVLSLVTRLIVLDNGRMIADGSREEVIAQLKAKGNMG
jgi:ATP-binding cassette subfamily C protein LapB